MSILNLLKAIMTNIHIKYAIKITGSQVNLAKACKVSKQAVHKWLHGVTKQIDGLNSIAIEQATNGQVTRSDLRPDIWPPK